MPTFLTRDNITEITGQKNLEQITEIEILFLTIDELGSLDLCHNLKKLTLLDNALQRISNLSPVSMTLTNLTLSDQNIRVMENLDLPQLRELYLHRNSITKIESLSGCPRLRKLWIFQNKISSIVSLHTVPELQECWLQSNQISSLQGIEYCLQLKNLALAGNPIDSFKELKRLTPLTNLRDLALSDIHFGRSLLADEQGYKEFILVNLRQVEILDGVRVTKEHQKTAEEIYLSQIRSFNQSLEEIDDSYWRTTQEIESQHQSKEDYSRVLEKEMTAALKELQGLVGEGRGIINKHVNYQQNQITSSMAALTKNLNDLEIAAKKDLNTSLTLIKDDFDSAAALLSIAEQIAGVDAQLAATLCDSSMANRDATGQLLFQSVNNNSADFQMMSSLINPVSDDPVPSSIGGKVENGGSLSAVKKRSSAAAQQTAMQGAAIRPTTGVEFHPLELVKLFKLVSSRLSVDRKTSYHFGGTYERVFTVMTPSMLSTLLMGGWTAVSQTIVFSSDAALISTLYGACEGYTCMHLIEHDYLTVLSDVLEDSAKEVTSLPSKSSSDGFNKGSTGERLKEALRKNVMLLVSCKLFPDIAGLSSANNAYAEDSNEKINRITLPYSKELQADLMHELSTCTRAQRVRIDAPQSVAGSSNGSGSGRGSGSGSGSSNSAMKHAFIMPSVACQGAIEVDFAGLCMTPTLQGGGASTIDHRLELLLMPTQTSDTSAQVLRQFEQDAAMQVKAYLDKLLEEVDEDQATELRRREREVGHNEASLRMMREEIERERRGQESMLRELKQENAAQGLSHSASNAAYRDGQGGKSKGPSRR